MTSAQATGHIRLYHSVVGGLLLLNLPISYMLLLQGLPPETVLLIAIGLSMVALIARLGIIAPLIQISITAFFTKVLARGILVAAAASFIGFFLQVSSENSALSLLQNLATALIMPIAAIWFLGLGRAEKRNLFNILKSLQARFG
ncbi:hypothetical protein D3C78_1395770 [compost metagenome]